MASAIEKAMTPTPPPPPTTVGNEPSTRPVAPPTPSSRTEFCARRRSLRPPDVARASSTASLESLVLAAAVGNATPGTAGVPLGKKSSLRARWFVLSLSCLVMTGSYYAYDIPAALHQQLHDYMPPSEKFETQFNLLYTVYSVPNVFLPLLGGSFVDRHGAPACLTLFASLLFVGASFLALGVSSRNWTAMYLGRILFGLGGESLCVAQLAVLSDWFEGGEVALAMGVSLAVSRLGSVWNNVSSPMAANAWSTPGAFWLGTLATATSAGAAAIMVAVDRWAERRMRTGMGRNDTLTAALLEERDWGIVGEGEDVDGVYGDSFGTSDGAAALAPQECSDLPDANIAVPGAPKMPCTERSSSETVRISDMSRFGLLFWLLTLSCFVVYGCVLPFNNVASGILLERNYFTAPPSEGDECRLLYPKRCTGGYLLGANETNPSLDVATGEVCDVRDTQAPLLPSSVNVTRSSFTNDRRSAAWEESEYIHSDLTSWYVDCGDTFWSEACTSDYCAAQHHATERAGRIMSIPYFVSATTSPLLGGVVDRFGKRAYLATAASATLAVVHLALASPPSSPVPALIGQGLAYSAYAAVIWPSIPLTVARRWTGTAYGIVTSIQNIGLALFPLIVAGVYNASGRRYIPHVEYFFAGCAVAGAMVGLAMVWVDQRTGGKLNGVSRRRSEYDELYYGMDASDDDGDDNSINMRNSGSDAGSADANETLEYTSPLLPMGPRENNMGVHFI